MEMETETGSKKFDHDGYHETDSSSAAIDLLPPEMLESIYKFLPFPDLLACREVSKKWKSVATDSVRKRCGLLDFSRDDIRKSQRSRALQSFIQLIRATDQQGDLEEFPVADFEFDLNSDYYWIEMNGSTLISQFLEAVSPFVKHIFFSIKKDFFPVPNSCFALTQDLTFPNLTEIKLMMLEHLDEDTEIFSFIRKVIEKSPNIKKFHLSLHPFNSITRNGEIRRCIVETGIEQKASLVTSFSMTSPEIEKETELEILEYLNTLGFKLNNFILYLKQHNGNTEIFKAFLKNQSDTLTDLSLHFWNRNSYQYFRELPCLPHLKNLSIWFMEQEGEGEDQIPALFYKQQLPALKLMDLADAEFATDYLMASHVAPSESLRELILPATDMKDAGGVIRQAARLFPNLKKLEVSHESAGPYMSDIYEALPGIEELCIATVGVGSVNVDDIITGLPKRILRKIRKETPPSYHLSKALSMLERGTTKTLGCLKNLKILVLRIRDILGYDDDLGEADFTEISGVVLKQMKCLQRIDFGIRKYEPKVSAALKEDLETRGIKLLSRRPPFVRSRTDFIDSLTESDNSDSDDSDHSDNSELGNSDFDDSGSDSD